MKMFIQIIFLWIVSNVSVHLNAYQLILPKKIMKCLKKQAIAYNIMGENEKNVIMYITKGFLDLGAYRGDTVEEFLKRTKSFEKIVAVEPDKRTFKKLKLNCESIKNCTLLNNAVWSCDCTLSFDGNKGRGASAKEGKEETQAVCVDGIFEKYGKFTYLNIDIEGAEGEMLKGAENALKHKPKICMAAYHRSEDIFELINKIHAINPEYRIYLRHHKHISFWDTNIYCI